MRAVLVTGASGGIGGAAALELARRGWGVALQYRSHEEAARKVEEEILRQGGTAKSYRADLTDEAQVEALFAAAEGDFGFLEGLVNNAGSAWKGLFTDMTLADWQGVLDADLTSVFLCCRRALPPMIRKKRGSIVNVSSMWGQVGASCEAAYSAAKAGVIGLTKALAKEEGPSGIRVNCLAPGVIDTPMNGDLTPEDLDALREETPLERIGTPQETAQAIAFLLEHPFVTGQVLGVSGGMVIN
ncbi:MAG: elongation factor P 5-aminopentanone reductase [Acutalibacter sp.]|jgi:3-oxoacyl-[acyl-carrier protein] reductase